VRFILFGSLKNYELIGISRGVHLDLSNGVSTTVCGVFLIPRFLFVINNGRSLPFKSVHRTILGSLSLLGLVILDGVHIGDKTSFIPDHSTKLICFVLENPLGTNDIMFSRTGNQSPNIISGELMELVMHGRHPAFIL